MILLLLIMIHHHQDTHQLHHSLTQQCVEAGPTQVPASSPWQWSSTLLYKYNPVIVMIAILIDDDYDNLKIMMVETM